MSVPKKPVKTKVIISVSILFAIIALGGIFYKMSFLPVIGTQIAEQKLSRYAKDSWRLSQEIKCRYDWYNGRYLATNDLGFSLDYRLTLNMIHDEALGQEESAAATQAYHALVGKIPSHLTLPKDISVFTAISADDYNLKAQRLYLLGVLNNETLSETESLGAPARIAMDFISQLGDGYNFTGIQMSYGDQNGMYEIKIRADTLEPLSEEKLIKHTTKLSKDQFSERYLEWLEENNFS